MFDNGGFGGGFGGGGGPRRPQGPGFGTTIGAAAAPAFNPAMPRSLMPPVPMGQMQRYNPQTYGGVGGPIPYQPPPFSQTGGIGGMAAGALAGRFPFPQTGGITGYNPQTDTSGYGGMGGPMGPMGRMTGGLGGPMIGGMGQSGFLRRVQPAPQPQPQPQLSPYSQAKKPQVTPPSRTTYVGRKPVTPNRPKPKLRRPEGPLRMEGEGFRGRRR